jgi:hypothetical protein
MTAIPAAKVASKSKSRLRFVRWCFLSFLVATLSLTVPQVYQTVLGWAIRFGAWRHGASVQIERIDGSLWEPVTLGHSLWTLQGRTGTTTRVEIDKTDVLLSWKNLLLRNGERWFEKITFSGVQGKTEISMDPLPAEPESSRSLSSFLRLPRSKWIPTPAEVTARSVDFVFQCKDSYIRLEDASLDASSMESGSLIVEKLTIHQPWLKRTFRHVHGKTALQDDRFALANVVLEPGVEIRNLSTAPSLLAVGQLDIHGDLAAFDGTIKFDVATKPEGRGLLFEAGGPFGQINIAKLASFLALSDAAGGTIKDGTFSFRGSLHDMSHAQASMRFDAVNFQWETRQWDSLALGVIVMDRRIQVPQLNLRQDKNELRLNGELTLPNADEKWWQGDFNANVDAKIENLTELSALLLPEFKYAAGKAQIEGSVRGRGEQFNGQLLVSGSNITWRNAPIETLHAAIKLNGNEINFANVELVNKDDYLRGRGLVKLTTPAVYWGELRVAVDDLTNYAAFLQKPVLPEPLAGGAIIDWTGEGSKEGYSGKFLARLRKVRSLGATAQLLHPINAELEATYSPGMMQFSQFSLSDDDSSFTANVAVGGKALNIQKIRLTHHGVVQLEGDALLPLDVWQQWPNVSVEKLLTPDVVSRVALTAHKLDLQEASLLTGWKFPIGGTLDGTLTADGSINALKLGGAITLDKGRIPLGWTGDVISDTSAQISFHDDSLVVDRLSGKHAFGEIQLGGQVHLSNVLDPALDLTLRSPKLTAPIFKSVAPGAASVSAISNVNLTIAGPLSSSSVKGAASLSGLSLGGVPDIGALWTEDHLQVPRIFSFPSAPWSGWQFDLACKTNAPIKLADNSGTVEADIKVTGPGSAPEVAGRIEFKNLKASAATGTISMNSATVDFSPARSLNPDIDLDISSTLDGHPYWATVTGPLSHLVRTYDGPAPLSDNAVRDALRGHPWPVDDEFSLEIYPPAAIEAGFGRVPLE